MLNKFRTGLAIALLMVATACSKNMGADTYRSNAPAGKVLEGVIISARPIVIKDTDKLAENEAGGLVGGIGGALLGNQFGSGSGNVMATAGGAIVGAVAGALVEDALSSQDGMEYIVKLSSSQLSPSKNVKKIKRVDARSVDSDIKNSIEVSETKTQMISVIMDNSTIFQVGQRVFVLYHNDRPRLSARH